jgi:hypothetical protein
VRWHRKGFGAFWRWISRPRRQLLVCGDPASDGGVVGTLNYRGIPLGQDADIYRQRQRPTFRQRIHTPHPGVGHSGSALVIPLALAERPRRTIDRIDPARVYRSSDRTQRRAPSADPCEIFHLLQWMESSCFAQKGCAGQAPDRALRGTSLHMQSWADCITGTHESSF